MNSIAEEAVAHEVARRADALADTYERLAQALRDQARPRLSDLIDQISEDEGHAPEPLQARRGNVGSSATFQAVKDHARRVG